MRYVRYINFILKYNVCKKNAIKYNINRFFCLFFSVKNVFITSINKYSCKKYPCRFPYLSITSHLKLNNFFLCHSKLNFDRFK